LICALRGFADHAAGCHAFMSTESIGDQKAARRREVQAALGRLASAERVRKSRILCERLTAQSQWQDARAVLLFAPLADEPDLWPLLEHALRAGKQVALPRFVPASGQYESAQIRDGNVDVIAGRFGVREPRADCPALPLNRLDLVLVPGVAFDRQCRRLGRGKGFYDRLLAAVPGWKCGVAFDEQLVSALPCEPHDVPLNCILTPSHWLVRQPGATGE
jgi:5-formyltetrahydrofolate cyclo-ligase